ncbi:MAG TPA: XRE family transcriptional regulator, partial [Firmicutes bacterium]|nr:XRE family transcriptional regulator [Bacillota bacterium]
MATKEKDEAVLILLGKRIVFLRKKKGYSQLTLSFLADVSKTYLSDVE